MNIFSLFFFLSNKNGLPCDDQEQNVGQSEELCLCLQITFTLWHYSEGLFLKVTEGQRQPNLLVLKRTSLDWDASRLHNLFNQRWTSHYIIQKKKKKELKFLIVTFVWMEQTERVFCFVFFWRVTIAAQRRHMVLTSEPHRITLALLSSQLSPRYRLRFQNISHVPNTFCILSLCQKCMPVTNNMCWGLNSRTKLSRSDPGRNLWCVSKELRAIYFISYSVC